MAKLRTASEMFYTVEDIMRMLEYSRSKCYKIIAQLNGELEEMGYCTREGRVSRSYFDKRYGFGDFAPAQKPRRATA